MSKKKSTAQTIFQIVCCVALAGIVFGCGALIHMANVANQEREKRLEANMDPYVANLRAHAEQLVSTPHTYTIWAMDKIGMERGYLMHCKDETGQFKDLYVSVYHHDQHANLYVPGKQLRFVRAIVEPQITVNSYQNLSVLDFATPVPAQ